MMAMTAVLLVAGALSLIEDPGPCATDCRPAFVYGSDKARTIDAGIARWSVHVVLVGCQSDLDALTAEEKATVLQVIDQIFRKEDLRLIGRTKTREFREGLAKQINTALKRSVVSDIAFLQANRSD